MGEVTDISRNLVGIPMPASIAALPLDPVRRVPVPWFVMWADGKPEFRSSSVAKIRQAMDEGLCWVCGRKRGSSLMAFVIGPMCTVNRNTAEPPCHPECAEFSVRACPFLTKPHMVRREGGFSEALPPERATPGISIPRNPGCGAVWVTRSYNAYRHGGSYLFRLGNPESVTWWAEGRAATRAEVLVSIDSGCPLLLKMSGESEDPKAVAQLAKMRAEVEQYLPA